MKTKRTRDFRLIRPWRMRFVSLKGQGSQIGSFGSRAETAFKQTQFEHWMRVLLSIRRGMRRGMVMQRMHD
jgi:hypothetical protein